MFISIINCWFGLNKRMGLISSSYIDIPINSVSEMEGVAKKKGIEPYFYYLRATAFDGFLTAIHSLIDLSNISNVRKVG